MQQLNQYGKILTLMIRRKNKQEWFKALDFMSNDLGELFVGYEASARLSELFKSYPPIFETKTEGKYRCIRIRFEFLDKFSHILPDELLGLVNQELKKAEGRLF